jgi:serine/threonine protein kinase
MAGQAPELLVGAHVNEKADIYSFGVLMWELTTGEVPSRGGLRPLKCAWRQRFFWGGGGCPGCTKCVGQWLLHEQSSPIQELWHPVRACARPSRVPGECPRLKPIGYNLSYRIQ